MGKDVVEDYRKLTETEKTLRYSKQKRRLQSKTYKGLTLTLTLKKKNR